MKKNPMVATLIAVVCLAALVAVNGLAVEFEGAASDGAPAQLEATSEAASAPASSELPLDVTRLLLTDQEALLTCELPLGSRAAEAGSLTCTAPLGCFDPETYCDCVESGSVPEWVCRWYFCE